MRLHYGVVMATNRVCVDPVLRWHPGSDLFVFRVHND